MEWRQVREFHDFSMFCPSTETELFMMKGKRYLPTVPPFFPHSFHSWRGRSVSQVGQVVRSGRAWAGLYLSRQALPPSGGRGDKYHGRGNIAFTQCLACCKFWKHLRTGGEGEDAINCTSFRASPGGAAAVRVNLPTVHWIPDISSTLGPGKN